jgi:site-specific DNA recombinase
MAVALYARVSTTRQADNDLSIPDQLRQMREWCQRNGHSVGAEYIEPGASATDDKRPQFQQLMSDCLRTPAPYEKVVVHSLSRFFRDSVEFGWYERKLEKHGVKVVSITQPTSDDTAGELTRRMVAVFDEFQSKENAKHTARAMRENARQGYFNGSAAPFGYRAEAMEAMGNRGRRKKRLAIDEAEAAIVRRIYQLYLEGHAGQSFGIKKIAEYLNEQGQLMRGRPWRIQHVHKVLRSRNYVGEHVYNVKDSRQGKKRSPDQHIVVPIPAIVDRGTFEHVRERREARAPSRVPPRLVSSPILLTGLLKCGLCGASMTAISGKSGRYHYYKCTSRLAKGNETCLSRNLPMEKLDDLVLSHLSEKIFTPQRLQLMIAEARRLFSERKGADKDKLLKLQSELRAVEEGSNRLYQAVEAGILPADDTLQRRAHQLKAKRDGILIEMSGLRKTQAAGVERLLPSQVQTFSKAIRGRLTDRTSTFARDYLRAVVGEIRVYRDEAVVSGSYERLMAVVAAKKEGTVQVPSFMSNWRARSDSNARPLGS